MRSGTENEWCELVFSGAGIVLLGGVGRWLYRKFRKPKASETPKPEPPLTQTTSSSISANAQNASAATGNGTQPNSPAVGAGASVVSAPVVVESNTPQQMIGDIAAQPEFSPVKQRKSSSPTFEQIRELENAIPKFQREIFRNNCAGIKIGWLLSVLSVGQNGFNGADYAQLSLSTKSHGLVYCSVKITDYPIVKMIRQGHWVWVEGEILESTPNDMTLQNVVLQFEELPEGTSKRS